MENEMKIPNEVIDLIQSKSFDQLSDNQRILVLRYVKEIEYIELYYAYQKVRYCFAEDIEPSMKVKECLSMAFASEHRKSKSIFQYRVEVWKIAATLIPMLFITFWAMNSKMTARELASKVVKDTIMVQQKIKEVEYVIDTLVVYKYVSIGKEIKSSSAIAFNHKQDTNMHQLKQKLNIGIRTLHEEDLIKELPNKNGRSMLEDELLKHFTFAGI